MHKFKIGEVVGYGGQDFFIVGLYGEPNQDQPREKMGYAYINKVKGETILADTTLKVSLNDLQAKELGL